MNRTQTALRIRGQIDKFMGVFSPHFSKPKQRFIRDMLFGIQAAKDVKLSSIARALDEPISPKKIEDRLSRNLDTPGLGDVLSEQIARSAASRIKQDTLIIVDPTDIRKQYARKMPFLGRVRDGSTGQFVNGYWGCLAVACEVGKRKMIPLHQRLWSTTAPHTVSENHQLLGIVKTIRGAVGQRGIYVMDRGGDRCRLYNPLMNNGLRFMIRLTGKRDLMVRGRKRNSLELAESCPMRCSDQIVRETQEGEKTCQISYGFRLVKLPGRKQQLYLVVVKGFGKTPLMILTNVAVNKTRKSLWFIVEGYLSRWLIEDAIRFIKQSYRLEDIRLLSYRRLQNMMALVLAAVYFSSVWLGDSLRLSVLSSHVIKAAKRFYGLTEFCYYALADGIAALLARIPVSRIPKQNSPPNTNQQILPGFT
jgi:hypothetical protein